MYLSPHPMRNSIFVVSNRSTATNNFPQTSNPSENSIYYNANQSNSLIRSFPQVITSPLQNSILSGRNQTGTNFLQQQLQVPSTLQSNSSVSLSTSTSRLVQPASVLDSFNTQNSINTPLNLVPSGSAITRNSYEPAHRCTTCGHVHTCNDCKHISNIQQVIDPPVKKVHEPIIINTAKAMGRMNRRMANGPYFRPERSRNVLISQDEILHRTMVDPNLNFTDIVNQVAKEKEQEQEKAMITGNFPHQNGHQNGYQNGYQNEYQNRNEQQQERSSMNSTPNFQNLQGQRQQQSSLSQNIANGFHSPSIANGFQSSPNIANGFQSSPNIANGFQSPQSPIGLMSTSNTRSFQSPISQTMEEQPSQDPQTVLSSDAGSTSALLRGPSQSYQEQLLNSNATILTTPDVTIICNEQPSSILTPIIRDSKLVDNSLGYKKTNVQYASPRKNVVAEKPRPNPVTPNIKTSNSDASVKKFFGRLWSFG